MAGLFEVFAVGNGDESPDSKGVSLGTEREVSVFLCRLSVFGKGSGTGGPSVFTV